MTPRSTSMAEAELSTAPAPARAFLAGLAAQDFERLATALSDDVHLRALLPAELREWEGVERVQATFTRWYGNTTDFELVDSGVEAMAGRLHLWWRARLRAERLGEGFFVVEQQAYADTDDDGHIHRMSLVCSGYLAEPPAP